MNIFTLHTSFDTGIPLKDPQENIDLLARYLYASMTMLSFKLRDKCREFEFEKENCSGQFSLTLQLEKI